MNRNKQKWDCEIEAQNKTALYVDDFKELEVWEIICKKFNVPKNADQIYFNPKDVTYGK
jgi:hypothetical protein